MEREQLEEVDGYQLVLGYLGVILMLIGGIVLLPLLVLFAYPNEVGQMRFFTLPGVCAILVGYLFTLLIKGKPKGQLRRHQDTVIVVASWALAIFVCALPFVLSGNYNFTQAIFECTSGWSTTGLSVCDIANSPKVFLMHRSSMLFFGGVGLVLVMLSVLSDSYGMRLYNAEGHSDKLLPNLVKSSRTIIAIYAGYIVAGMLAYMAFGMDWFDGLNHSIAALSTGGFSTRVENIGYYNSLPIEIISIVLMLLGCTNFLAHLYLIRGKFRSFFRYCEVKIMLIICLVMTPLFALLLIIGGLETNLSHALRVAAFQVVTALTTTGFQTVPTFVNWTPALILLTILLMLIGGGTGSTAGGIKQFRVYVVLKSMIWNIRNKFSHQRVVHADRIRRPDGDQYISQSECSEIYSFVLLYLLVFVAGTFTLTCFGYSLGDSMFEFSSALGTVGISVGITAFDAPKTVLWTETIGMFVGRLEIYVVFLAMIRITADVRGAARHMLKK